MYDLETMKLNSAKIRAVLLRLLKKKNGGHIGGSMSIVEMLSVLYSYFINFNTENPNKQDRDYLVLSKGHAGPALYSALCIFGFFPEKLMEDMNQIGTIFPSHPDRNKTPGVDATTGSLGQGISVAAGIAYALKIEKRRQYVYAIVGDGEINEGQCWEAFQFIANYRLNNLIVFIDNNKRQLDGFTKDVMNPFDISKKMEAFGFNVQTADGADEASIAEAIIKAQNIKDSAVCIVLDTIKGQGVQYFENMANNHSINFSKEDITAVDEALKKLESFIGGN